jgi:hypothetical protein
MKNLSTVHRALCTAFVVSALLLAASARATVIDVAAPDAQVCRFPAAAAATDPVRRWFAPGTLTCSAASAMTFPEGRWNVFARTNTAVSLEPLLVDSRLPPESLHLDLAGGAVLTTQLPPGASGVVYFPHHAAAVPGEARTVVPAGEELWLFVVVKGTPVAVFTIAPVPAGVERAVDARALPAVRSLLGWVSVPDADQRVLQKREVSSPAIRASGGGRSWEALDLPKADHLGGAFVLFTNVERQQLQLELHGRGWLTDRAVVTPADAPLTFVPRPLVARLSANLTVNWSTSDDLEALDHSIGECESSGAPKFELTISSCAAAEAGRGPDCGVVRREPLPPLVRYGTVSVGEVAPGTYKAELRYGKLPPVASTITLAPLEQRPLNAVAQYLRAYGSLTRGGRALDGDARIEFPAGGIGFARAGQEYAAVLVTGFDTDATLEVVTCRGERTTVLAERPLQRWKQARFDIDIPGNLLKIRVIDTFTHAALPSPSLHYVVLSKQLPRRPVLTRDFKTEPKQGRSENVTDDEPAFAIRSVPPDRPLVLEVSCHGYKTQKLDEFSLSKSETKSIDVELVPVQGDRAKVVSSRRFDRAMLYWYSPDGTETGHAEVDPDGTFVSEGTHYRNESLVLVSKSHPLWILHAPVVERRKPLQLAFPDNAPARNITVLLAGYSPRLATPVGIAVGGLRVPAAALIEHFAVRGLPAYAVGGGPMLIPSIAETGPIDVLRGPSVNIPLGGAPPAATVLRDFVPQVTRRVQPGNDTVSLEGH